MTEQVSVPTVHIFTDEQLQELVAKIVPPVKSDAEAVVAEIKKLVGEVEGAAGGVHGAAKTLKADVVAHCGVILAIGMAAVALALHFLP